MFKKIFVGVPHLAAYIFLNLQIEQKLGADIDPGIAFTPFPLYIVYWMRQDLNPQPLDRESSLLTTRPD